MSADRQVAILMRVGNATFALGTIVASGSLVEPDRRAENAMHAMLALPRLLGRARRYVEPETKSQEVFLRVVRSACEAQYGKRDEEAEQEVSAVAFRHYGLGIATGEGWES